MLRSLARPIATASIVIAIVAVGCAKGTEGAITSGGDGGSSSPSTMDTMSSPSTGGAAGTGGGTPSSTTTLAGPGTSTSGAGAGPSGSSTSASTSSSSGTGGGCSGTHLLISQIKTRGALGGSDEFVELFNPTASAVTLDSSWTLTARAPDGASYTTRWKGGSSNQNAAAIPAHGHYLIAGSAYVGSAGADDTLTSGIKDASSVLLEHSGNDVDAVCFTYSGAGAIDGSFTCNGSPADNTPHDDTTGGASDTDVSIERKGGGCTETGDDASDFMNLSPSAPHDHDD